MNPPRISVVLPSYEEAGSIVDLVEAVLAAVAKTNQTVEVIVVDDASPDGTADRIEERFATDERVRVLRRQGPRGLAASIHDGIRAASGELLIVMDADFNHDPDAIPGLLACVPHGDGARTLVSGSRFLPGGGMYSAARLRGSRWMSRLARALLRVPATDFLAGYFVIDRRRLERLPLERIFHGYGDFYLRLLVSVHRAGWQIVEHPVTYPPRRAGTSKSPLLRMAFRYGAEIVRIRLFGV